MPDLSDALFRNYQSWLGQPAQRLQPDTRHASFAPDFQLLVFRRPGHAVLASVGASHTALPGSLGLSPATGGVRQEYLLHAPLANPAAWASALMGAAALPFATGQRLEVGVSLPLGNPQLLPDTAFSHLYLTLPFQDDPGVLGSAARGALRNNEVYVQTLWLVPLYLREHEGLHAGEGARLEAGIRAPGFQAANPARPPLLL